MTRFCAVIPLIRMGQAAAPSPIAEVICDTTPRTEQRLQRSLMAERAASGVRSVDQVMEDWTDR